MNQQTHLTAKDLINVGIYSVLYFFIMIIIGLLGFIPVFIPFLAAIPALLGGIPFMLFLTRVEKFGMVTLLGTINGILMFIAGMGYWVCLTGLLFGLIADIALARGQYKSPKLNLCGYTLFSGWLIGNFIPFFVGREEYFAMLKQGYSESYAQQLETLLPIWSLPFLFITCILCGAIGSVIGKRVCSIQFKRAGIV
ncbi:MptD family putative ECF transporter S component [Aeromonas hydrophila]|uniref:MptD family putative ECF transporter S component n=1 Tax=Aeromonas hydrophila TaxID=644 RepID=UPI00235FB414|nr:MptD family putative ECF transporter S component [Aeromonas hydrophila]WDA23109.1 MptD family putative ECF transporter S component [Aeromonas hydrophila]WES93172.1 MptD family putative ECF transporter S component [Aeromonas hydrophila]